MIDKWHKDCEYKSGEYEYIERDKFSRSEYVYNWDNSEYRHEEEETEEHLVEQETNVYNY